MPEELIIIATFENSLEAAVSRGALEAQDIPAYVPISLQPTSPASGRT